MARKILVVDDEESIVDLLSLRLTKAGYEVETAENGMDGLNKARTAAHDLIILDIMLPGINGYKVCQMLKFDENFRHIPIILLTAKNQDEDRDMGMKTGADLYLVKSIGEEFWQSLLENVQQLLGPDA